MSIGADSEANRSSSKSKGSVGADSKEGDRSLSSSSGKGGRVGSGSYSGGTAEKGGRVGGGSGSPGADSKEGDRSVSRSSGSGGRAGTDSKEGDRSLSSGKGGRVGTGNFSQGMGDRVGTGTFGGRSISADIDPTRFGGALPTPTTGRVTRGLGAAIPDRTFRDIKSASMDAFNSFRTTDLASMRRAQENESISRYNAAQDFAYDNSKRADAREADMSMGNYYGALKGFYDTTKAVEAGTLDPYSRVVRGAPGTPDYADITGMTINQAVEYASKLTGKPSHVIGGFQFKDTTLAGIAKDMGIPGDTKMSPEIQSRLALGLAQRRANEATVGGVVDKAKFANAMANEWASFANPTGKSNYDKNGIDKASVGYAEVRAMTDAMVDTGVVGPNRNLAAMGDNPNLGDRMTGKAPGAAVSQYDARTVTASTKERFASTYLGTRDVADRPIAGTIGATGYDPSKNPARAQVDAMFGGPAAATAGVETQPPAGGVDTQIGLPNGDLSKFPEAPQKQRSIGGSLLAGGIDILSTAVPVVGPYIGAANAGLSLMGRRTGGEVLSDAIMNGDNEYQPGSTPTRDSNRSAYNTTVPKAKTVKSSTTAAPAFADKYLTDEVFVDDGIKRPTPAQKWGEGSVVYS